MKAIITGGIATFPVGGVAWDYGQYALALERLGFDVCYLEDAGLATYDVDACAYSESCEYGVRFLRQSLADLSPSLADRWHFRSLGGTTYGLDPGDIADAVAEADLF